MGKKIHVVWSKNAKADLKHIFECIKEKTQSTQLAKNTKNDIIKASKNVLFSEQYQIEAILGEPYRRIVVRHYKLIYKVQSKTKINILKVFDTYKHPNRVKDNLT